MNSASEMFKALSDPTRLRIMRLLLTGELCICDLMESLDLPQSRISRHMTYLKNAGWVTGRRSGKWVYYKLKTPETPLQHKLLAALHENLPFLQQAEEDYERLCRHLETKKTCE